MEKYKAHMSQYYYFLLEGYKKPVGYVHKAFVQKMIWPKYWKTEHDKRLLTLTSATKFDQRSARTQSVKETLQLSVKAGTITAPELWTDESFPIHAADGTHVLDINRPGLDIFGVISYFVHMIGWTTTSSKDGTKKFWVPQRSPTKSNYPNMLDNTVGGCLSSSSENPLDGIVRECEEEISLDSVHPLSRIKACGITSYHMTKTDSGEPGCQSQVQYLYEMEIGGEEEDVVPRIGGDGEVGEIFLMSLEEVKRALADGEFKPNCAMTWLSYLIRHGHLNAENEAEFVEIACCLNRRHELFDI